jgi:hypothetical protein
MRGTISVIVGLLIMRLSQLASAQEIPAEADAKRAEPSPSFRLTWTSISPTASFGVTRTTQQLLMRRRLDGHETHLRRVGLVVSQERPHHPSVRMG